MADYIQWLRSHVGSKPIFINAAAAIICNDNGEVLLQRRGGGEKTGAWSFPGGAMDIGERARDTVVREVREETGLDITVEDLVGVYTTPQLVTYPNDDQCQMVTQVFVSHVTSGTIRPDGSETLELRFFPLDKRPVLFRPHLEQALIDFASGKRGVSY